MNAAQALGGECSNHSGVDFLRPDAAAHPRFGAAAAQCACVALAAGDALFMPEGTWHQVDSDGATLAVNYWRAAAERVRGRKSNID